jgi:3-oxoadipate enol-lactonase
VTIIKIKANQILINYELTGTGKCLTMLHGLGDNLNVWYNQVPVFSKYYQVITYDARGHGQTELPEGEINPNALTEDLFSLLKALNINETFLLGHSMGARVAHQFTSAHQNMVKALILCDGVGGGPPKEDILNTLNIAKTEGIEGVIKARIDRTFSPGFIEKNQEAVEQYKAVLQQMNLEGLIRFMQPMTQPRVKVNKSAAPEIINCPTLIIVGEYDHACGPSAGKDAQNKIQGSQLRIFPTGHAPALERSDEFNRTVLDFLSEVV